MRKCPGCKQIKSFAEFHKDTQQKSGLKPYCKVCTIKRAYSYYHKNSEEILKKRKIYRTVNREHYLKLLKERAAKYRISNKKHIKARQAVNNAIIAGKVIKSDICEYSIMSDFPCEGRIEAHHYKSYAKENWFDIKWLCRKHHIKLHYAKR